MKANRHGNRGTRPSAYACALPPDTLVFVIEDETGRTLCSCSLPGYLRAELLTAGVTPEGRVLLRLKKAKAKDPPPNPPRTPRQRRDELPDCSRYAVRL